MVGTCGGDAEHVDGWMRWYMTRYCDLTPTTSWPDPAASWSLSMAASEADEEEAAADCCLPRTRWRRVRLKVKTAVWERETGEPGARLEEDVKAVHRLQGDHEHAPRDAGGGVERSSTAADLGGRIWEEEVGSGRGIGKARGCVRREQDGDGCTSKNGLSL